MARKGKRAGNKKKQSQGRTVTKVVYREPPKKKNTVLGDIGALAGNAISRFFGLGSYQLKKNSVVEAWNRQVPFMHSSDESIVFRHREYICDITSSVGFSSRTFSVNAGVEETFPYLAQVAANFEQYQFKGLVFEYKSTSADALNSTNTALGTVILAAQYRADAPVFTNKLQMENTTWAATTKPSESCFLPIECDPDENPMPRNYVRTGPLASGQDIKFYDLARVSVGTVGSQAAAVVGELWATYEVELRKPLMVSNSGGVNEVAYYYWTTGITAPTVLGTGTRTANADTIGLTVDSQNIRFPQGCFGIYRLTVMVRGSSTALSAWIPTFTNCTQVNSYPGTGGNNANPQLDGNSAASSTNMAIYDTTVNIGDPNLQANIFFGSVSIPASPIFGAFMVVQLTPTWPSS